MARNGKRFWLTLMGMIVYHYSSVNTQNPCQSCLGGYSKVFLKYKKSPQSLQKQQITIKALDFASKGFFILYNSHPLGECWNEEILHL